MFISENTIAGNHFSDKYGQSVHDKAFSASNQSPLQQFTLNDISLPHVTALSSPWSVIAPSFCANYPVEF
ncbi:hypothetical protein [Photobacterium atrarenae]|uniref:Right handed beta helix domain-containing protein n=1 Tax=Photobacterium atrarenae TaxID=865757 RepID=A0ABY5GKN4_9GAMM|nr:hypothetical protein [Photobacterium atrarenae]UTV29887.1 hypothetical protein NNL38_23065 [Photobacterium atrarenae]